MKEILETAQVKSNRSQFVIDLVKHNDGFLYVEISQTIVNDNDVPRSIKINSNLLAKLVNVLRAYDEKLLRYHKDRVKRLSEVDQAICETYYYKGVSIKDMSKIFSQPEELIENALRNRGIPIVSLKPPRFKYWRRYKK